MTASVLYMMKMPAEVNTLIKTVPVVEAEATLAVSKLAEDVSPWSLLLWTRSVSVGYLTGR